MTTDFYLDFPMEGIGLDDTERLIDWLSEHRDFGLWHQMSYGLSIESPGAVELLTWIAQQPDCDRATAAAIFVHTLSYECLYVEHLEPYQRYWPLAETICTTAQAGGYTRSTIADPSPQLELGLSDVKAQIDAGCAQRRASGREPRLPVPEVFFESPYPEAEVVSRYLIEQDCIVRIDSLDERARQILGYGEASL